MATGTIPNTETASQKNQFSDGNADGQVLGQSASDKLAFYGAVPMAQRAPGLTASLGTASSSWSGTASTSSGSTPIFSGVVSSILGSVQAQYGNWTTGSSAYNASVNGASATASVTVTATGSSYNSLLTASGTSFNSVQAAVLAEVVQTLVGLGIWKAS